MENQKEVIKEKLKNDCKKNIKINEIKKGERILKI